MGVAEEALSDAIQDYLKEIYKLRTANGKVTTTALAKRLRVSPASVSAMVKKLAALGLAEHVPYHGVDLTPAGEKVALEVVRHHRLLELYLAQTLGIAVESVHAEADRLEHVLSDELEARIDSALGYPTHDPHGDPIPDAQLQMQAEHEVRPLSALAAGEGGTVRRIAAIGLAEPLDDIAGAFVPPNDIVASVSVEVAGCSNVPVRVDEGER